MSNKNAEGNSELFGPLKISITFHGRSKTKVWKKSGNSTHIYRSRAPLFSRSSKIYDDSFRSQNGASRNFPFTVYFPDTVEYGFDGGWDSDDRRYALANNGALPPSFNTHYSGFVDKFECFVEYRIGVAVSMPGLKIDVQTPGKYDEPLVYYERPRLSQPINDRPTPWKNNMVVKNELLLPRADRPSGFRQKAKAAFSSDYYPTYAFDWTCDAPRHVYVNEPITFNIRIQPRETECTAVLVPDVLLTMCHVNIKSHTDVRTDKQFLTTPESDGTTTEASLVGKWDSGRAFSKANDWTKTVNLPTASGLTSAFQTCNISVSYSMKVELEFTVAGKTKEFENEFMISVHPPLQEQPSGAPIAGPSGQQLGTSEEPQALPRYEEPPDYGQAWDDRPPVPPKS